MSAIFVLEAILKIIAFGFYFCGSKSYIRNYWNILDFFVVLLTVASYMIETSNLNSIKVFRLIKIFRPLRAISKNQRMKLSINALYIALPGIAHVILISILFLYIFAVISVNYFKG